MLIKVKRFLLNILDFFFPLDLLAKRYPISAKGIIYQKDKVILLKTNRNTWDLPGGKINSKETPEVGLKREVYEELNLEVKVGNVLDTYFLNVQGRVNVFIVIYECFLVSEISDLQISFEHEEVNFFSLDELEMLSINSNYKRTIKENRLISK